MITINKYESFLGRFDKALDKLDDKITKKCDAWDKKADKFFSKADKWFEPEEEPKPEEPIEDIDLEDEIEDEIEDEEDVQSKEKEESEKDYQIKIKRPDYNISTTFEQFISEEITHEYWGSISDELIDKIVSELGYTNFKYIAQGDYGVVLDVGDNKMIKLTEDAAEAHNASILRRFNPKHLINYYDVRRIHFNPKYKGKKFDEFFPIDSFFAIVMDKIKTLSSQDKIVYFFLRDLNCGKFEEPNYDIKKYITIEKFDSWLKRNEDEYDDEDVSIVRSDVDRVLDFYNQLNAVAEECKKIGIPSRDLHSGNLGWKEDDILVAYDFGVTSSRKKSKLLKAIEI
jgi:hypothetical protein